MESQTTGGFDDAVILPRPGLRISYDADGDVLRGLVPGEVFDGHLDDETECVVVFVEEDEDGEQDEDEEIVFGVWSYFRGAGGPRIGFSAIGALTYESPEDWDDSLWDSPRFDVPTLALVDASVGEILLAARMTLRGSTPDQIEFDIAVAAGEKSAWEAAESAWRACLACGEMKAHYGLGYTLVELDRPREGFGHLMAYTRICPRNAWAWCWRGRAAVEMGERDEARRCYQQAIRCEEAGSYETDASHFLARLDGPK